MGRNESELRFEEAKALHRAGRHQAAIDILDDLIIAHPDSPRLGYARALCLQALGRVAEAMETCEHVLSHDEHERTRALLAQLRETPLPARPKRKAPWFRAAAWLLVLGMAAGVLLWLPGYWERLALEEAQAGGSTQAAITAMEAALQERLARPAADPPGIIVHPREEWIDRALAGRQFTEPGIYEYVPSLTRDTFNFNYFLPTAYGEYPDTPFPWLVISHPGGGTHFLGLIDWAEERGVILIVFNQSGLDYPRNPEIQEAGLYAATELLRIDQGRGMAIGVSGGARTNWEMVNRHPRHFTGLVMIAFAGADNPPTPPHVRVAFINGDQDFNARAVNRWVPRMRRLGREVLHLEFPGGHEAGALELRTRALDWVMRR